MEYFGVFGVFGCTSRIPARAWFVQLPSRDETCQKYELDMCCTLLDVRQQILNSFL